MAVRTYRPTNAGIRFQTCSDFEEITRDRPEKTLIKKHVRTGGRNNYGRQTSRHMGGGHKRRYRMIDFRRNKDGIVARVVSIEYDPNRSSRIALLHYKDGEKRYILSPIGLKVGQEVLSGKGADILPGNCLPLENIPIGTFVHNIEMRPGKGGQLARSAGCFAQLMARESGYAFVKMPSGELRRVLAVCRATIGQVGNEQHENIIIGKAGRNRWLGWRPYVRATSMNPVDHPMGGGEGRGKGNHPQSPWGQPAKGYKTRRNKRTTSMIVSRRKK